MLGKVLKEVCIMSDWTNLFNGSDLTGWRMRHTDKDHAWIVENGLLINTSNAVDIVSVDDFGDFQLHIEYMFPEGSNSGIYLRGRYELQILDSLGKTYDYPAENGAIYNFKRVDIEVTKPAGEWQIMDVTLVGMVLTVDLNGERIHDEVTLENPTGGQLFNDNELSGPLMLQGDHGPVSFRNIRIRHL